jgi:uncharacterized membrane protein YeaQ/YmgE (transglycosylase-associated protein family)
VSNIIWIIIIGFIAGLMARVLSPGPNDPKGFILTTLLGIVGAFPPLLSARPSVGIGSTRGPVSSPRPSVR